MNQTHEARDRFLISGGDPSADLDPLKEALDQVAAAVDPLVERSWLAAGNHGDAASAFNLADRFLAVVALVSKNKPVFKVKSFDHAAGQLKSLVWPPVR